MITYTKLKSGEWGIRSDKSLSVGASVVVTKKSGESKTEQVANQVWTDGKGIYLYGIVPSRPSSRPTSRSSSRRSRGARYCEGWGADNPHAPRPPYTCEECALDE